MILVPLDLEAIVIPGCPQIKRELFEKKRTIVKQQPDNTTENGKMRTACHETCLFILFKFKTFLLKD